MNPFSTPASIYHGCDNLHGRTMVLETLTEALRVAAEHAPDVKRMDRQGMSGDGIATVLAQRDGSCVRHFAWHKSFDGMMIEAIVTGGRHGDCTIKLMTGMNTPPAEIMPDHSSDDAARNAALCLLESIRTHLEASLRDTGHDKSDQEAALLLEGDIAAAHATPPVDDDMVYIQHATPWQGIRAMELEPGVELLDPEIARIHLKGGPTRLSVTATLDGNVVVVEPVQRFVDAPDTMTRLRTIAAHRADPASAMSPQDLDVTALTDAMTDSLIGGRYWDAYAITLKPDLADCGSEHLEYVLEHCMEMGYTTGQTLEEVLPERRALVRRWAEEQAADIVGRLSCITVVDGRMSAHRLLCCDPEDVRNPLGAFWTWDLNDWCDPYSPWAENGREERTIAVHGSVAVEHVDWWTTALSNMDWYCGGENELRVIPGSPVRVAGCFDLDSDQPLVLPDLPWVA